MSGVPDHRVKVAAVVLDARNLERQTAFWLSLLKTRLLGIRGMTMSRCSEQAFRR